MYFGIMRYSTARKFRGPKPLQILQTNDNSRNWYYASGSLPANHKNLICKKGKIAHL